MTMPAANKSGAASANWPWYVMAALALLVVSYAVALLLFPNAQPPFLRERSQRIPITVFVHLAASAVAGHIAEYEPSPARELVGA